MHETHCRLLRNPSQSHRVPVQVLHIARMLSFAQKCPKGHAQSCLVRPDVFAKPIYSSQKETLSMLDSEETKKVLQKHLENPNIR